jgi:two-component system, OmpR family, sensor kinase
MRPVRSLRTQLLWWLLGAIVVTVLAQAGIAYGTALGEANEIFDYQMEQTALSLRHGLPLTEGTPQRRPPVTDRDDDFIVQVWSNDGTPVFKSIDLPGLPPRAAPGYSDAKVDDTLYRVFVAASATHTIQVAQDLAVRRAMARTMALRTTVPVAFVAPLLMAVVWWMVSAALAPLARVRTQIARRQADDLSAVDEADLPDEVRPLIDELNLLFRRLRQAFDAQQSFVADAAHELRSPLAALRLQVQALARTHDGAAQQVAMSRLGAGIDRATRLVEQLLALARQQANAVRGGAEQGVSLTDAVRLEIDEAAAAAHAALVDVRLARADEVFIDGYAEALRILLRNLIDNAIKHTPAHGAVAVEVVRDARGAVLRIEDSGPGIPPEERERVLDRFYRVAGNASSGSGLGLAIVKAVADMHGARIQIDASPRLGGLRVEVAFQVAQSPPARMSAAAAEELRPMRTA